MSRAGGGYVQYVIGYTDRQQTDTGHGTLQAWQSNTVHILKYVRFNCRTQHGYIKLQFYAHRSPLPSVAVLVISLDWTWKFGEYRVISHASMNTDSKSRSIVFYLHVYHYSLAIPSTMATIREFYPSVATSWRHPICPNVRMTRTELYLSADRTQHTSAALSVEFLKITMETFWQHFSSFSVHDEESILRGGGGGTNSDFYSDLPA
jgi:hypothetical protein